MKTGVIGLGFMGAAHVAAISSYPRAQLAAVVTNNPKAQTGDLTGTGGNLQVGARQFDFSNVKKYTDWHDLISDETIEAVTICLPTDLHCQVTLAALAAGKHVLCEKPMALTPSECDRMLEAADKFQRRLMIAHVLRFWPEYIVLREFIAGHEYGPPRQANFLRKCGLPDWSQWLPDQTRSGGAIMDLLIHDVDQILLLFGIPERVTAKRLGDTDALMASFIYTNGPEVRLQGGWFTPATPFSMSFRVRADQAEIEFTPAGLQISDMTGNRKTVEVPTADPYEAEVHYFLDCCQDGIDTVRCPARDSAKAVAVALALQESRAKDGEQVRCLV